MCKRGRSPAKRSNSISSSSSSSSSSLSPLLPLNIWHERIKGYGGNLFVYAKWNIINRVFPLPTPSACVCKNLLCQLFVVVVFVDFACRHFHLKRIFMTIDFYVFSVRFFLFAFTYIHMWIWFWYGWGREVSKLSYCVCGCLSQYDFIHPVKPLCRRKTLTNKCPINICCDFVCYIGKSYFSFSSAGVLFWWVFFVVRTEKGWGKVARRLA